MIYAISLGGFIKKNFSSKTIQSNHESLINNLPLDPKVSGMDIVLIQSRDMAGFRGEQLARALKTANSNVSVLYIYVNEKELNALLGVQVTSKKVNKINPENVCNAVQAIIEMRQVQETDSSNIPTKDSMVEERVPVSPVESITEKPVIIETELPIEEVAPTQEEVKTALPTFKIPTIEERLRQLGDFGDFDYFKHALKKENMVKEIMTENTRFAGAVQMLDVLDREIANIFVSQDKSVEEKMDQIRSTALRRVAYKEVTNNILVDKFSNIMLAIIESTEATMDRRIRNAKAALDTVASAQILYKDTETLNKMVAERLEMQVEIHELQEEIISLYQAMDKSVNNLIESFNDGLPSENDYINEHLKVLKPIFNPENATTLAQRLLQDLASGRVKLSLFENQLTQLVKLIFALCEADTSLIEYQQNLINLLKSNRVEDVVIVDTILKSCMRLYIGPSEIGTRTTAITWAGIISRRSNCLLIDLSGKSKFKDYGISPVKLEDFLNERIQEQFLCVEGLIDDGEERIREIIMELKLRLNYYPYINIILDPAQKTAIKIFAEDSLTAHFVTDSSPRSIAIMKNTISGFEAQNIAKKVVLIAPAVDPIKMCNSLTVDTLTTKIIVLPYMQRIRALAFNRITPHTDKEVVEIFEEAFR